VIIDPKADITAALRALRKATGWTYERIAIECRTQGADVSAYTIRLINLGDIKRTRFDIGAAILNLSDAGRISRWR
jgi:hypothetical protein